MGAIFRVRFSAISEKGGKGREGKGKGREGDFPAEGGKMPFERMNTTVFCVAAFADFIYIKSYLCVVIKL